MFKIPYPGFRTFKISPIIDSQRVSADFQNDCHLRTVLQKMKRLPSTPE